MVEEYQKEVSILFDYLTNLSEPVYIEVLTLYYVEGKNWQEVIKELCYSKSKIFVIRNKAIEELDSIIKQSKKHSITTSKDRGVK